ncbi:cytochrome c biogenesis protein CCS1, chloroplastic isoform X1 [Morus notabilis]|uniref:cytochrome c biogenesis protein CCS1, chloroplastic isoform X1 n=1 Tax=Morus notabilis TaxID=981085 RepID=UPI000CECFCFC|nr:cytochrome c biogenesis protein CCS1, chloroplastic isoform X1 [Morus notabilis]
MESLNPTITSKLSFHKPLFVKPSLSHRNISKSIFFSHSKRPFSFTTTCKLKSPQDNRKSQTSISKKILLSEGAPPPLAEEGGNEEAVVGSSGNDRSGGGVMGMVKRLPRKVLAILSNLPLAIGEMFTVAALMALGTIIDQGEAPDFYFQKYPEENPFLGFFTWRWVLTLGFDHVYSSPIFLGTLALLGTSLMACTYTTQIPLVKVARRWNFLHSAEAILKQEFSDTLPRASVQDLGVILMGSGYEVFLKGPSLYAFKGLAGRFAPIGVHLAMLLIMAGGTLSATGSFRGSVTVPQGLNFVVGDVLGPTGFLSAPTEAFNTEVHVNRFYMDYYDSGEVSQFHTDLSLYDLNGKEVLRKTISVNDPLRYGGITIYQTDWSFSALQILKDNEGPFNLAMAPLKINGDKKLFGTFLPIGDVNSPNVKGISMLARDLQSIVLYDQEGKFVGIRRPNSKLPIEINGTNIVIEDAIGSSGLDLKTDPGVPIVYAGFGALMLTTCISYLSHAQIWAFQDGTAVVVGAKTNRAKAEFPDEMNRLLDQLPEIVESSSSK